MQKIMSLLLLAASCTFQQNILAKSPWALRMANIGTIKAKPQPLPSQDLAPCEERIADTTQHSPATSKESEYRPATPEDSALPREMPSTKTLQANLKRLKIAQSHALHKALKALGAEDKAKESQNPAKAENAAKYAEEAVQRSFKAERDCQEAEKALATRLRIDALGAEPQPCRPPVQLATQTQDKKKSSKKATALKPKISATWFRRRKTTEAPKMERIIKQHPNRTFMRLLLKRTPLAHPEIVEITTKTDAELVARFTRRSYIGENERYFRHGKVLRIKRSKTGLFCDWFVKDVTNKYSSTPAESWTDIYEEFSRPLSSLPKRPHRDYQAGDARPEIKLGEEYTIVITKISDNISNTDLLERYENELTYEGQIFLRNDSFFEIQARKDETMSVENVTRTIRNLNYNLVFTDILL